MSRDTSLDGWTINQAISSSGATLGSALDTLDTPSTARQLDSSTALDSLDRYGTLHHPRQLSTARQPRQQLSSCQARQPLDRPRQASTGLDRPRQPRQPRQPGLSGAGLARPELLTETETALFRETKRISHPPQFRPVATQISARNFAPKLRPNFEKNFAKLWPGAR